MDLATATAVAAITAAGISLVGVVVNVVLNYRLTGRTHLEEWRRNEELPIVARLLALSDLASENWLDTTHARADWINSRASGPDQDSEDTEALNKAIKSYRAGSDLYEKLRFEAAQLDLIAGHSIPVAASRLLKVHWSVVLLNHPQNEADDWFETINQQLKRISMLRSDLVRQARTDLGANRGRKNRLRSLWRRFRAWRTLSRLKAQYPELTIEPGTADYRFVVTDRATGKRVGLATTIENLMDVLARIRERREREESSGAAPGNLTA